MHWIHCMPFYFPLSQADTYLPTPDSIFTSYTVRLAYMPYMLRHSITPASGPYRRESPASSSFFDGDDWLLVALRGPCKKGVTTTTTNNDNNNNNNYPKVHKFMVRSVRTDRQLSCRDTKKHEETSRRENTHPLPLLLT